VKDAVKLVANELEIENRELVIVEFVGSSKTRLKS
jgi:hypothetical protein